MIKKLDLDESNSYTMNAVINKLNEVIDRVNFMEVNTDEQAQEGTRSEPGRSGG